MSTGSSIWIGAAAICLAAGCASQSTPNASTPKRPATHETRRERVTLEQKVAPDDERDLTPATRVMDEPAKTKPDRPPSPMDDRTWGTVPWGEGPWGEGNPADAGEASDTEAPAK